MADEYLALNTAINKLRSLHRSGLDVVGTAITGHTSLDEDCIIDVRCGICSTINAAETALGELTIPRVDVSHLESIMEGFETHSRTWRSLYKTSIFGEPHVPGAAFNEEQLWMAAANDMAEHIRSARQHHGKCQICPPSL